MDKDIEEIKRRAGLLDEQGRTFSMAAHEDMEALIADQLAFYDNLARVITRVVAPQAARELVGVLRQRSDALKRFQREKTGVNTPEYKTAKGYRTGAPQKGSGFSTTA